MAVQGVNDFRPISNNISSGYRINSAADDAAGLAISEKMLKESNGLDVGASNTQDGMGALNIADGALEGMTDNLQRIRELSLKAMNGTYSRDDRSMIQEEISQLLDGIQDIAKNTQFNSMKLLDGSMADMHIASNPDGSGMEIKMVNTTLESLGIKDYDVTSGKFDISAIDKALEKVTSARGSMGAQTNRMEHSYNYNTYASELQTSSYSRLKDLDMPKGITKQKQEELLKQYQTAMLRKKMEEKRASAANLFQ